MSRAGEITLPFGPEEHLFRLGIKEWEAIDEALHVGPGELLRRFEPMRRAMALGLTFDQAKAAGQLGEWRVGDLRAVFLQGLIGGGTERMQAGIIVRREFDDQLKWSFVPIAATIVEASFAGPMDDVPLGERKAAKRKPSRRSRTAASGSPASTATAP